MKDYKVETILREPVNGYGRSVLIVVAAKNRQQAEETAKREFIALTGLPATLIEEINAASIYPNDAESVTGGSRDGKEKD